MFIVQSLPPGSASLAPVRVLLVGPHVRPRVTPVRTRDREPPLGARQSLAMLEALAPEGQGATKVVDAVVEGDEGEIGRRPEDVEPIPPVAQEQQGRGQARGNRRVVVIGSGPFLWYPLGATKKSAKSFPFRKESVPVWCHSYFQLWLQCFCDAAVLQY